jgi:hypothetical protein
VVENVRKDTPVVTTAARVDVDTVTMDPGSETGAVEVVVPIPIEQA